MANTYRLWDKWFNLLTTFKDDDFVFLTVDDDEGDRRLLRVSLQ